MKEQPNYYAIITANVRYDKRLKANEKLMYGEVTALSTKEGYCWANNKYFAELYDVSKETVSRWVANLVDCGYIKSEILYKDGTREIDRRILSIPIDEIINTPLDEIINTPIDKKINHSNTSNNNTSINISFDTFWNEYDKKIDRPKAEKKWNSLTDKVRTEIMEYIPKYKIAFPDKQYRRYPMTFLNNETWENELENTKTQTQNINLDTWN